MSSQPGVARLSVLDRLIDEAPRQGAGRATLGASAAEFKDAFLRDLEWLLNTRRVPEPMPERFPELTRSVYHYGLPDITSLSADSSDAHQRLARDIEECIRIFEPRFASARVLVSPSAEDGDKRLRFVIDGVLRMDPQPVRIVVDTVLETPTGKFTVAGEADA